MEGLAFKGMDMGMQCRGVQFRMGETLTHHGYIGLNAAGFHFCFSLETVHDYYPFTESRVFVVKYGGKFIVNSRMGVSDHITVLYEVTTTLPLNPFLEHNMTGMLIFAVLKGSLERVKALVDLGVNLHAREDFALRWASHLGHLELVQHLVDRGANIHARDNCAIKRASLHGHIQVVRYLTEKGADPHADDHQALKAASRHGHLQVVHFLEDHTRQ